MNRTKLKEYARQARRDFIQAVTDRAAYYGLAKNKIEPIIEHGDVAIISGHAYPRILAAKRKALEDRIRRLGFDLVIEAIAYTWFNRLVALRFMELHGYLNHGYRVLSHPEGKTTPEILEHAEHIDLRGLDKNKVIELKLDGAKETELYRMLLIAQCNALHNAMPFLFERIDDETELLLPDNLLHSDSLIRKLTSVIDEEDWQQVEIIGWLYQFYISEKNEAVIGKIVKSEDIPAATQLFTPNWIVKYMLQNSVGRMWLATYPQSGLRAKMDYYIEPAEQTAEVRALLAASTPAAVNPELITILDPACGSGHILVEAYDLLKEVYLERGYRLRDIPRLILKRNLFGLDIDDRAAQLAAFALLMKARADDRRIFDAGTEGQGEATDRSALVGVFAIQESAALDPIGLADALLNVKAAGRLVPIIGADMLFDDLSEQPALAMTEVKATAATKARDAASREDVFELVELFRQGKTLGSLISVPQELTAKLPALRSAVNENLQTDDLYAREAAHTLLPFVEQAEVLARKYGCVITNPPYMGSKYINPTLKEFLKKRFAGYEKDLFSSFIIRNLALAEPTGQLGFMSPFVWMFISSYEELRAKLIEDVTITTLIQLEYSGFDGATVPVCTFTIVGNHLNGFTCSCIRLSDFRGAQNQGPKTLEAIHNPDCGWFYKTKPDEFKKIPGSPIAYWASERVREVFETGTPLGRIAEPRTGLQTGENERFLRLWTEVPQQKFSQSQDNKSAKWFPYNKGGDFKKWYGNADYVINWEGDGKDIKDDKLHKLAEGLCLLSNSKPKNQKYYFRECGSWSKISSSHISVRYYSEAFLFDIAGCAVFTESQAKLMVLIGFLNTILARNLLNVISPTLNYQPGNIALLPVIKSFFQIDVANMVQESISLSQGDWDNFETSWNFQTFPLLGTDLKAATVEASSDNWQAQCNTNIRRMEELETGNNRLFIEAYGLQNELTPEVPEDQITLARADREADIKRLISYAIGCMMGRYSLDEPGLVYAHSGNDGFDPDRYKTFAADADGIVPITESEWFTDDAANRFREFIRGTWPAEHLQENLIFIAESIGRNRNEEPRETIRRYIAAGFFKDHLKTYKKRPIYWLFTSGKYRAFQCLVYLHRYNEGTLSRMRTEYVIPLQGKMAGRVDGLAEEIQKATSTAHIRKLARERDTLLKQQAELQIFDEKLRHYADMRISLDLDDGVKVNYGKFGDLLAEVKAVTGGSDE